MLLPTLTVLAVYGVAASYARLHHALAEDVFAFPKYRVSFLNGLPLLNETAERWLSEGLRGGELEFLDRPWQETQESPRTPLIQIGSGDDSEVTSSGTPEAPIATLQRMALSPTKSFLCLIPPPRENRSPKTDDELRTDTTPSQSLNQLQALSGSCLYHKHGWFTYSYCHGNQVRQFREAPHSHPHPQGGYVPEEDPEWEAYTLGRAPDIPSDGRDLTVAQQTALANSVVLADGPGHRYLAQTWGGGTICDKTGKPRVIEVQFHCSLTMTDTILFVKETKTCHYQMVIHTPRLCGEPGFKTRLEQRDEAYIQCREVFDSVEHADGSLSESTPFHHRIRSPILPAPPLPAAVEEKAAEKPAGATTDPADMIRRAIAAFMGSHQGTDGQRVRIEKGEGEGEMWIELLDMDVDGAVNAEGAVDAQGGNLLAAMSDKIEGALRAAMKPKDDDQEEERQHEAHRDEL